MIKTFLKQYKMQPTVRIKTEYSESIERTLCYACLSSDRKLNALGEFEGIYRQICPTSSWLGIQLCWECRALLRNVKSFQTKSQNAQCLLKTCSKIHENYPKSLSNLSICTPGIEDPKLEKTEVQKHEIKEQKIELPLPEQAIKEEIDIEYNNDYNDDSMDYRSIEEIKDENLPETLLKELQDISVKKLTFKKQQPAERNKRYKMTHRKLDNAIKKVPIEEKDIDSWIEREKNSAYYKKLKSKCDKCVSRIHNSLSLRDHYRKFHLKSKTMSLCCRICQQYFSSESNLSLHMQQHCSYYRCDICGYSSYNKYHITRHVKEHTRVVNCLECEATFNNTRKFFVHYKAAHTVFICDYCTKRYKNKHSLERHIYRLHKTHKCDLCNVSFGSYRTFTDHYKLKHRIERSEASYCVQCNLQFDTVPLFRRHITSSVAHSHERKNKPLKTTVPCLSCSNVYARKTNMMNHYRLVHLKQTKHYCNICQKWFLNSTRYKDHVKYSHERKEKERTRICYVCGRGFYTNRILSNHMRTHTGERPFECPHCEAKFAQKVALDSHVRFIHLKNKRKTDVSNSKIVLGNQ